MQNCFVDACEGCSVYHSQKSREVSLSCIRNASGRRASSNDCSRRSATAAPRSVPNAPTNDTTLNSLCAFQLAFCDSQYLIQDNRSIRRRNPRPSEMYDPRRIGLREDPKWCSKYQFTKYSLLSIRFNSSIFSLAIQ